MTMTEIIASIMAIVVSNPTYSKSEAIVELQTMGIVRISIETIAMVGAPLRLSRPAFCGSSPRQLMAAMVRPPVINPVLRVEIMRKTMAPVTSIPPLLPKR